MSKKITLDYLSKLLNKTMTDQTEIALSSAQKSRLHGWLINNGIKFNEFALVGRFNINQLLGGLGDSENSYQSATQENLSTPIQLSMDNFKIGVDIQRVDELFPQGLPSDPKADQGLAKIFTAKELSYAQSKSDAEITLTGIFCAKEAIQKTSDLTKSLYEIEVLPNRDGRPQSDGYAISISHSGSYAIAIAIENSPTKESNFDNSSLEVINNQGIKKGKDMYWVRSLFYGIRVIDVILFCLIGLAFILKLR